MTGNSSLSFFRLVSGVLLLMLLSCSASRFEAQVQDIELSDEEKERKIPPGVEEAHHGIIEPSPINVESPGIYPPFWWCDMKNPVLEICIRDNNIAGSRAFINYKGIEVLGVTFLENPNYAFVKVLVEHDADPGAFSITLSKDGENGNYPFELKQKPSDKERIAGLNTSDFIYLLMPDRFSNGDPSNDSFDDMNQSGIDRNRMYYRHGGDIQGIVDHLDYLQELGVTAIWPNPVFENDQPYESYHGYAMTAHYKIDKRFGTNEDFKNLCDKLQSRKMKMVKDIIFNHVGDQHWMIRDLPARDWIHQHSEYKRTNYRAPALMDPYASNYDKDLMTDGWFDHHMPDLNQKHPQLATFLIQNSIWWVEYAGIDAYRIDTYAYPDQEFMSKWAEAVLLEYPDIHLFAETWVHGPAVQAQFTGDNFLRGTYNSKMPAVTDFQLYYAIKEALTQNQGWTEGASRIYFTLAQDFLYEKPYGNVIFLDNHDLNRFLSDLNEDRNKMKCALTFLLTMRGIPSIYYGTEILMSAYKDPDGKVRADFPGGWVGDPVNKFTKAGRSDEENETFNLISKLAKMRQKSPSLQDGKLIQFVPENGLYVYFRQHETERIMIAINFSDQTANVDLARYAELVKPGDKYVGISTDLEYTLADSFDLKPFSSSVFVFD
jgi:glycosidase